MNEAFYQLDKIGPGPVFIVDDEQDVHALTRLMFNATCKLNGHWPELTEVFKSREVFIISTEGNEIAQALDGIASAVRVLGALPPVTELLEEDPTGARLMREAKATPPWERISASGRPGATDDELISELAALPSLDYAKRRKDAAQRLGIGVGDLDKAVARRRGEQPDPTPSRWTVEPWPTEVSTADLLLALEDAYRRHVILPEHGTTAMALWCLHCWALGAAYVSPFLMFTSPEPRCGKSTALSLLYRTCPRTTLASNISSASVFRYIDRVHPVLLIDEADTYVRDDETMRGILNSGHSRNTAFVIRCEGDDNEPKEFSTWAPKAIASIDSLAATLRDRAIIVRMKRRKPGEYVTKLRTHDEDVDEFAVMRRKAMRWSADNVAALKAARPNIPRELNDRAQDNWEPLLAIADMAGGDWPKLARSAAIALSTEADGDSTKVRLLVDIRAIFEKSSTERMPSFELVGQLTADAAGPWAEFGKGGKPLTQKKLAHLLHGFGIEPKGIRTSSSSTPKGYEFGQFQDSFQRYLPGVPPSQSATPQQVGDLNDLEPNRSATRNGCVADRMGENTSNLNVVADVAVQDPLTPKKKGNASATDRHACAQCQCADSNCRRCEINGRAVWLHQECKRFYLDSLEGGGSELW